ncbi:MAG: phosphoglycerate kinase [Patescibacteria group bacterium]|nr:phosphoglycerate kinase [Patescibacteria group bacterium]
MIRYLSKTNLNKLSGKICLLRIDLNVESENKDNFRLNAVIPTIKLLLKHNIKVVLLSHKGRPVLKKEGSLKGLRSDWDFNKENRQLSLRVFTPLLQKRLGTSICFVPYEHSWLLEPKEFIAQQKENVFLFENLRFYHGEEINDWRFAKFLSDWGDFYVNDAFALSHRTNASVCAITKFLPSYAGLLMEKEIKNLSGVIKKYRRPFYVIIGGAKISDKIGVIKYFWERATGFLLCGGPANTFFAAKGLPVGNSTINEKAIPLVKKFLNSPKIILPTDVKIWKDKNNWKILDIGQESTKVFKNHIKKARTVIWNGPVGLFEKKGFERGTREVWQSIFANKKLKAVIGGGETLASFKLLNNARVPKNVFISTGGGAMLEYLSGKRLPGIEVLK